jgi:predicted alpha/beta superfamily hydrolase
MIPLTHYPAMKAPGLIPRDVWVWMPPAYHTNPHERFPVIYMHDGQNLFDPAQAYDHVTWGVAEAITKLSRWGFIQPAIVVGIGNTENRLGDYLPARPFESPEGQAFIRSLSEDEKYELAQFDVAADKYLQFMVEVVKPMVDRDFRTRAEMQHTIVMGSSMGGLISLYALVEYPQVFGGAGCFSTHWPAVERVILPYLESYLPEGGSHRIYFDYGSVGYDAEYAPHQEAVDTLMREKGYVHGVDWLTRLYPGADHHERAWRTRLHIALRFLLGNARSTAQT